MNQAEVDDFWAKVRVVLAQGQGDADVVHLPQEVPQVLWFGATPEQADELLALVLGGVKTGSAAPLRDYEAEGEALPTVGDLSIILDGGEHPRAVIRTSHVEVVRFDKVTPEHAYAEGEGDRSLDHWRAVHEWFFKEYDDNLRGFSRDMLVVCERFDVLYTDASGAGAPPVTTSQA